MPADLILIGEPGFALRGSLAVIAGWLVVGFLGLLRPHSLRFVGRLLFPLGAGAGIVLFFISLATIQAPPQALVLPLGLPDLPFHVRTDALSAFFLLLLGAGAAGISMFAAGYFRPGEGTSPGLLCLQYHVFLASMALVMLADDAYLFMVAWEMMALSSYFLVTSQHRLPEIRRAGFLYLLIAHLGALAILLAFGVLQAGQGDYTFASMRASQPGALWASITFFLAFLGFGAKAGIVPLHVWLPEAHPAAPSPVSAMMSAVMLKTAIYGLLRLTYDLLGVQLWWWGVVALAVGLLTMLYGVLFAAVQTDMKRLLAYSSIENVGSIVTGFGLSLVFHGYGLHLMAALALTAALYHCLNHAFFKSLLFLSTGHVLHATGSRNLGKLGGLIHRMPWLAGLTLVGVLGIAALPPLNGFVSEWLLLQAFLFSPGLPNTYLIMLIPLAAAAVVLSAALGAYVMVKFYGVIFLGHPREEKLKDAHDAGPWELAGLAWLALPCLLLGVFPVAAIVALSPAVEVLVPASLAPSLAGSNGWYLTPIAPERASYAPFLFLCVILLAVLLTWLLVKRFYHGRLRRTDAWDCGFPGVSARMQDTAEGFGQPIRQIFEAFFRTERHLPTAFDERPRYYLNVEDRLWHWLYLPVAAAVGRLSAMISVLQRGRIHLYLLYSFATLLLLLVFVR